VILTRREFNTGLALTSLAGCDVKRSILFPSRAISIPQITAASLPAANQNQPYSFQLTETGGTYPITWSAVITPNTGGRFSIDPVTGILSGTQTVVETETVTVQVTDNMAPHNVAQATFTLAVNSAVVITTASLPSGTSGSPYSTTLAATGGTPPYIWSMSPTSLDGLTLNASTGVLSGTPTSATTASATFTATDALAIPSAPVSLSFTASAPGGVAPSRIWRGPVTSTNATIISWPPSNSSGTVPDPNITYNLYRSTSGGPFVQIVTGIVPVFISTTTGFYQIIYIDGNTPPVTPLTPNTNYTYYWTAVTSGVESPPGPQLAITTLAGTATPTTLPVPPLDPATWVQPYSLPVGGTTWTATNTSDPAGHVGVAGTTGSTGKLSVGCSFQYALNNCAPGDIIVLTAGGSYTSASSNGAWQYPLFTGPKFVYVISSQADSSLPGYNGAAAQLPAYSFSTSQGGLNYVTPANIPAMPQMVMNSVPNLGFGHNFPAGSGYFRFVGIAFVPAPSDFTTNLFRFISTPHGSFSAPVDICNQIYFDRCYFGNDSANYLTTFSVVLNAIQSNINGLLVHQCYLQGFYNWANEAHGVAIQAGGPVCIQNTYIESATEGVLTGGLYGPELQPVVDIVYRYNTNFKQPFWFNTNYGNFTLTAPPTGNTATVTAPWPHQRVRVAIIWSTGGNASYGFISNGPGAGQSTLTWDFSVPAGATAAITLYNPIGLWVKNHFEMKIGQRVACYGNVHTNCSNGFAGQQPGNSFTIGPRALGAGGTATAPTDVFQTNPWDYITDVDIHDNVILNVGEGAHIFSADNARATGYIDRVRFANNLVQVNPPIYVPNAVITHGWGLDSAGPTTNFIVDHNTFIVCPTNVSASNSSFAHSPYGLANAQQTLDRITFTNNVMDGTFALQSLVPTQSGGTTAFNTAFSNCIAGGNPAAQPAWNDNITIIDSRAYPSGTLATNVTYPGVGMANFVNNATSPSSPSDWNVVSGTYATASTTGGPIGSIFSALQFPLLGGYLIGGNVNYSAVANIGTLDAVVFSNNPGFSVGGKNLQQQVAAVKALNPAMKITAINSPFMETFSFQTGFPNYASFATYNWFLKSIYPTGGVVPSQSGGQSVNVMTTNLTSSTDSVRPNATYRQWQATWSAGWCTGVAPNLDGIYTDNYFFQPRVNGDYLQNGTTQTDSIAPIPQDWRNAYVDHDTQLRAAMGSQYMHWGNVADWANGSIQGYNQLLNGGVLEGIVGSSFAAEISGWASMMNLYAICMRAGAPFKGAGPYMIFNQQSAATNFAGNRYGLCSCLLDNGYWGNSNGGSYNGVTWLDEMGFNLGAAIAGPNNPTNGTYSNGGLTVWQNGVWRRDFQNGIILVNPRGNTAKTVTLEIDVWHLRASTYTNQDPTVNNATKVTAGTGILMPDPNVAGTGGSGLFLSRTPT